MNRLRMARVPAPWHASQATRSGVTRWLDTHDIVATILVGLAAFLLFVFILP